MIESERVVAALLARLRTDGTLAGLLPSGANSVFRNGFVPQGQAAPAFPYVVVGLFASEDVNAIGGYRILSDTLVHVTVWGQGLQSALSVRAIADRIDTLLQGYAVVIDGVELGKFVRGRVVPVPPENVSGVIFPRLDMQYATQAAA